MSSGKSAAEVAKVVMELAKKGIEVTPEVLENLQTFAKADCEITDKVINMALPGAKGMAKLVSGGSRRRRAAAVAVLKKYYGSKKDLLNVVPQSVCLRSAEAASADQ